MELPVRRDDRLNNGWNRLFVLNGTRRLKYTKLDQLPL